MDLLVIDQKKGHLLQDCSEPWVTETMENKTEGKEALL